MAFYGMGAFAGATEGALRQIFGLSSPPEPERRDEAVYEYMQQSQHQQKPKAKTDIPPLETTPELWIKTHSPVSEHLTRGSLDPIQEEDHEHEVGDGGGDAHMHIDSSVMNNNGQDMYQDASSGPSTPIPLTETPLKVPQPFNHNSTGSTTSTSFGSYNQQLPDVVLPPAPGLRRVSVERLGDKQGDRRLGRTFGKRFGCFGGKRQKFFS